MHEILRVAEATLAAAGVASPRHDAHTLAAHLIGTDPLTVRLMSPADLPATFHHDYAELITRRAHREPLQHILGTAPFGPLTLAVGPGVFIPRPETEQLADWVATHLGNTPNPLIIDLCTGSGAIAGYLAHARPDADIYAVELSPEALTYTHTNLDPLGVTIVAGDATNPTLLEHLNGKATAVVTNPPYVPHTTEPPTRGLCRPAHGRLRRRHWNGRHHLAHSHRPAPPRAGGSVRLRTRRHHRAGRRKARGRNGAAPGNTAPGLGGATPIRDSNL